MKKIMIRNKEPGGKAVVALGKFDGIHLGHAGLINSAVDYAKEKNALSVVYVMDPMRADCITDIEEKISIIGSLGADALYIEPLNEEFMNMTPSEFVSKKIKDELNACHVVVGYNFRFGKNRSGNTELLCKLCKDADISVTVVDCVFTSENGKNIAVSSTEIRRLASFGKVEDIPPLLGRYFAVSGMVEPGKKLGRTIGFPTANLLKNKEEILLRPGVYVTRVTIDTDWYYGITNIGENPTVESPDGRWRIETYIHGFDGDIYGRYITLEFFKYIREEKKFSSVDELKKQLTSDVDFLKQYKSLYGG